MADIRVGVVGVGFIGLAHIEALRRIGIDVAGVVGSDAAALEAKAAALRLPRVYPSYAALLADPSITVVHLATPNYLHYEQAKAAILAGKHVLCEKPLALTSQQSGELVQLADERGIVNAMNFSLRFYPLCHQVRDMLATGAIGDFWFVRGAYLQDWLLLPTDWNWRLEPELGGTLRAVADIGSHWLDLVSFITGRRVAAVMADLHTFVPVRRKPMQQSTTFGNSLQNSDDYTEQPIDTEDYASLVLRYSDGTRGTVAISQVSAGRKNHLAFDIAGSRASLAWNSERPDELWIGHRDRANELLLRDPALLSDSARGISGYPGGHAEGFPDTFKQLYQAVYRAIAAGAPPASPDYPTFADGHEGLLLGDAILRSAREERWVTVER